MLLSVPQRNWAVSYTHLDVYKRQDNHISKVVLNANNNGVTFTIDGVPYTSPIMVAGKSITRMEIDTTLSKLTLSFFYDGQIIKRYVSLSAS